MKKRAPILLKGGFIVDGSGSPGYRGDVLIDNGMIVDVSDKPIKVQAEIIDCVGKVVAPGFIDMHSHNDWFMPSSDRFEFFSPFIEQGITTYVAGNCGFSAHGFKRGSAHLGLMENSLFKEGLKAITWNSLDEYIRFVTQNGMRQNIVTLTGHGTTRTSIRGYDASPMRIEERREVLRLIDESLEQGACGVSFGMGYAPDIFTTYEERKEVAKLVKKKNGLISVHVKAFSTISGAYPIKPFGSAHNLMALQEMLDLARETGVRMQISHLIFVGKRTWKTLDRALGMIDQAINEGLDVHFDTYAHNCGATVITGILPDWFMAEVPGAYTDKKLLRKARILMSISFTLLGFNASDMQIAAMNNTELEKYNGMFVSDIASARKVSDFEAYITLANKSNSSARMLLHKYSNHEIILELMRHRASHFMTDAWVEPAGLQNPGAFASFPRFLQLARDTGVISLEEAVHKMTGKNASRAAINDRGLIAKKMAADITVFDWKGIADNTTLDDSSRRPSGIELVLINGEKVLTKGRAKRDVFAGVFIR